MAISHAAALHGVRKNSFVNALIAKCHISSGICGAIYFLHFPATAGMGSVYNDWLGFKV